MERAKYYYERLFFNLAIRVSLIVLLTLGMIVFVTRMSIQAHSESDVKYKQESIFEAVKTTPVDRMTEINPEPAEGEDLFPPVSMSYEIDKITPTPTPVFDPNHDDVWIKLAQCESKQNWSIDTGNGYYGGLQFSLGAWGSVGGQGKPSEASKEEQIERGKLLQARRGWGVWGVCAKRLGLN